MNNNLFPPLPPMYYQNNSTEIEIKKLKQEIQEIKNRLDKLEAKNTNNFMQKEDDYYIL